MSRAERREVSPPVQLKALLLGMAFLLAIVDEKFFLTTGSGPASGLCQSTRQEDRIQQDHNRLFLMLFYAVCCNLSAAITSCKLPIADCVLFTEYPDQRIQLWECD
jgi:hypothetical protein